jgi:hypothetical protein
MIPPAERRPEGAGAYELVAFDLRVPGAMKRLISEGAAWRHHAHVEMLDPRHAILVVRAGGAWGSERRVA